MIGRLLCWVGLHVPPAGINPAMCIFWVCDRCGARVSGELGSMRRRR